jgi:hypothetical protein
MVSAQSLTTLFNTNNNGSAGGGIYFQIVVGPSPITITSIDENLGALATGTVVPVRVYTAPTTYVGNEANAAAWTLAAEGTGTAAGANLPTPMNFTVGPIVLAANTSYGIAVTHSATSGTPAPQSNYYSGTGTSPAPGANQYANSDLTLNLGDATNVLFTGTPFNPRIWNGTIHYGLGGTTGACCRTDGSCGLSTSAGCAAGGGVYHGDNSACAAANCPAGGACCLALGNCSTLTSAACAAQSGIYRGDGSACATAACPGAYHMDCSIPGTFTDISATGAMVAQGDDVVGAFTSTVTNALVTNPNLYACTNGFISDAAGFNTFSNTGIPTASATFGLFPDWDDLYADSTSVPAGAVLHQSLTENGVPVDVIEWYNVRTYFSGAGGPTGNFEVKIFGAGGPAPVQFLYQGMAWDWNGNSSTVGVQWASGLAFQKSFGTTDAPATAPFPIDDNSVCSIVSNASGPACYANCDLSTTQPCLNVLDFGCFLNKFAAGDTYANCDTSTTPPVLNVLDFGCFLNKFAAGCSSC